MYPRDIYGKHHIYQYRSQLKITEIISSLKVGFVMGHGSKAKKSQKQGAANLLSSACLRHRRFLSWRQFRERSCHDKRSWKYQQDLKIDHLNENKRLRAKWHTVQCMLRYLFPTDEVVICTPSTTLCKHKIYSRSSVCQRVGLCVGLWLWRFIEGAQNKERRKYSKLRSWNQKI